MRKAFSACLFGDFYRRQGSSCSHYEGCMNQPIKSLWNCFVIGVEEKKKESKEEKKERKIKVSEGATTDGLGDATTHHHRLPHAAPNMHTEHRYSYPLTTSIRRVTWPRTRDSSLHQMLSPLLWPPHKSRRATWGTKRITTHLDANGLTSISRLLRLHQTLLVLMVLLRAPECAYEVEMPRCLLCSFLY